MAAPPHPPHSLQLLDSLHTSLNAALLEVAYSMKNPARPQLNHIAVTNPNPQNLPGPKYANPALTLHLDRFHVSLDDLERELFRAQSVLRRDVAVHRAAREAREAEEARAAAEEAQKQKEAQEQEEQQKKAAAAAQSKAAAASRSPTMHRSANQDNDVTMTGTDAFTALPSTAAHTAAPPKTLPNNSANKPLAVETSAASNAQTGGAPETAGTTTGSDDLFGRTPTTAGLNHTDLDSMFEDLTNEQDNGSGDADDQQGEIDFALLPGLETYANIDSGGDKQQQQRAEPTQQADEGAKKEDESVGDMFDFGLGSTDQSQKQNQGQQQQEQQTSTSDNKQDNAAAAPNDDQKQEQDQQPQQDADAFNPDSYANDSTFDDMFNYADFDLGGDGAGDGTGADTAFDDDFFNI
ncbi:uncharacterized protein J3D65DRAFT_665866 [Phyllosticta citribraziliensis]|uniref:Uncharacterized protein n=1 Tax=Phyllosticta citribraziliensis TaxID=989973 RepID=A0ABR1M453_9PEZI